MKLQFDATQEYQLEAVGAIVNLFRGHPPDRGTFITEGALPQELQLNTQLIVGNNLVLTEETILKNLHVVQKHHNVETSPSLNHMHFSVEMETGTGKTYVYLRTIYELHRVYGFKKFIIVVPSIAIKEGVMKNLDITHEHLSALYENPELDFYVYNPKKRGQLKHFATTNALQILVINIDSFAKFSHSRRGQNIMYQESDWGIPIEYIQGTRPIVVVDEPQNMETDIRKKAIENLNPLCTLRYSATHKYHYHLVYKLDPVRAYDLGLVKKIEVDSIVSEDDYNEAYIQVQSIQSKGNKITAKLKIDKNDANGIQRRKVTVRVGDNLYPISGKREIYQTGYTVNELNVNEQSISFDSGVTMYVGQTSGELTDEIMRFQIEKTVQNHFEKEKKLQGRGIKVLSLFFIDRVKHYRDYTEAKAQGKFAAWFEESFKKMLQDPRYRGLIPHQVDRVHNGYFSQDSKTGTLKDTTGESKADNDTYALIMKEKERLLSIKEPLRFIFSHSALREGWDNPNVFQICTLNESRSEIKKRQEIGRGLRLPVDQTGNRIFDDNINILTVIANESYQNFARTLQREIEHDCGVRFEGRIKNKSTRRPLQLQKGYQLNDDFKALWERIQQKTRYRINYRTSDLIEKAARALKEIIITPPKIVNLKARFDIGAQGVDTGLMSIQEKRTYITVKNILNIFGYIQHKTHLAKDTILKIIQSSGKAKDISINPQQFIDSASACINAVMKEMIIDGIKYEKIANEVWEMREFENEELEGYLDSMFEVENTDKTLYDYIIYDSHVEKQFARDLDTNEHVKFYLKLPPWFKIKTPVGSYNPDWAVVFERDNRVYFVAETKSTTNLAELRGIERMKIKCGKEHFAQLKGVKFIAPVTTLQDALTPELEGETQ